MHSTPLGWGRGGTNKGEVFSGGVISYVGFLFFIFLIECEIVYIYIEYGVGFFFFFGIYLLVF